MASKLNSRLITGRYSRAQTQTRTSSCSRATPLSFHNPKGILEMKLHKNMSVIVASAALTFCVAAAHAQDLKDDPGSVNPISPLYQMNSGGNNDPGKRPVAAARGVSSAYDSQLYEPSRVQQDANTLSGAESFALSSMQPTDSVFDPSLVISTLGETGGLGTIAPAQT